MYQSNTVSFCVNLYSPSYSWCHNSPYPVLTPNIPPSKFENHQQSNFKVFQVLKRLPQAKDFSWLPRSLPPHCKFILSTVSCSLSCKSLCTRPDVRTVEFSGMGDEDTKFSIFRQHLSAPDQERFGQNKPILRKKPNLNPLKLAIIASELQECHIYRNEFQCLREYLEVASIPELWDLILKRWVEDYGWNLKHKEANSDTVAAGKGLGAVWTSLWEFAGIKVHGVRLLRRRVLGGNCQRKRRASLNLNFRSTANNILGKGYKKKRVVFRGQEKRSAGDLSLVPSMHFRWLTVTLTPFPGDLRPSGLCRHLHSHGAHKLTQTHIDNK